MEDGTDKSYSGTVRSNNIMNGKGALVIARYQQGIIGGELESPHGLGMAQESL